MKVEITLKFDQNQSDHEIWVIEGECETEKMIIEWLSFNIDKFEASLYKNALQTITVY